MSGERPRLEGGPAVVLGSNAFSGAAMVAELLGSGCPRVVGLSRSEEKPDLFLPYRGREDGRFEFHQADLAGDPARVLEILDEVRPEVVYNFAALVEVAPSNEHPGDYFTTNCVALADLVDGLRRRDYLRLFVQVSTPEVYGTCPEPLAEDAPFRPSTPYAASKAGADLLLGALHHTFGFPVMYVRATNYYGRHQPLFKIIPRTAIRIRQGQTLELHGGGRAEKTWIHVRDVTRALLALGRRGRLGEVYHLADTRNLLPVHEVVRRICRELGVAFEDVVRVVDERPGQDARYLLDDRKARHELDWKPEIDFGEGVRDVIRWIDESWDAIQDRPELQVYEHRSPRA